MCSQGTTKRLSALRRGGCGAHAAPIDFFKTTTEHADHRSVRFQNDEEDGTRPACIVVDYVPSRSELSEEERRALWCATSDVQGATKYEEFILSANAASRRSSVVRGVLSEQDSQRRRGSCDETRLFFASSRRSEKSRQEALQRGMQEARELQLYQTDWLSSFKNSKPKKHVTTTMSHSCGLIKVDGEDKRTNCSDDNACSSKSFSHIIDARSICTLGGNEVACIDHTEYSERSVGINLEEISSMISQSLTNDSLSNLPESIVVHRKSRIPSGVGRRRERSSMPQTVQNAAAVDSVANEKAANNLTNGGVLASNNKGAAKKKEVASKMRNSINAKRLADALCALQKIQQRNCPSPEVMAH